MCPRNPKGCVVRGFLSPGRVSHSHLVLGEGRVPEVWCLRSGVWWPGPAHKSYRGPPSCRAHAGCAVEVVCNVFLPAVETLQTLTSLPILDVKEVDSDLFHITTPYPKN